MWNDTDIPLAYLMTFRCYGTWLHGDERGSVDRFHNVYDEPFIPSNEKWERLNIDTSKSAPVRLDALRRAAIEIAIKETCEIREWNLIAINVRTNHVHLVVAIGAYDPGRALNALKANATRMMRELKYWTESHSPWVARGSKRYLWNDRSVELATDYVINGQGAELPRFD